jgi:hypothetical protein
MGPYAIATVAMVLWSRHSDQTGERQNHSAFPLLLAAIALGCCFHLGTEPIRLFIAFGRGQHRMKFPAMAGEPGNPTFLGGARQNAPQPAA